MFWYRPSDFAASWSYCTSAAAAILIQIMISCDTSYDVAEIQCSEHGLIICIGLTAIITKHQPAYGLLFRKEITGFHPNVMSQFTS